jgi:hypothetical protein
VGLSGSSRAHRRRRATRENAWHKKLCSGTLTLKQAQTRARQQTRVRLIGHGRCKVDGAPLRGRNGDPTLLARSQNRRGRFFRRSILALLHPTDPVDDAAV